MSIVDRTGTTRHTARRPKPANEVGGPVAAGQLAPGPPGPTSRAWWQLTVPGARVAVGSWLVLALPALVVWVLTPLTTVSWTETLGVAGAGWFLAHGLPIHVGLHAGTQVSVAPLGLTALILVMTTRSLGRVLDESEADAPAGTRAEKSGWPRTLVRRVLPGYALGYAGVALVAWLLTLGGVARPSPVAVVATLWVPVVGLAVQLARRHATDRDAPWMAGRLDAAPRWLTRAVWPGLLGSLLLLAIGTAIVLALVVVRIGVVTQLQAALGAGVLGGVVLTLGQLLVLPNLGAWAVGWVAGPGFGLGTGASVSLSGGHPGLLPLVPVLGALPPGGPFPRWVYAALAIPVVVGFVVARRACRSLARLTSWRTKLATSSAAVGVTALGVGVLGLIGSGSLGVDRLQHVGVTVWLVVLAVLGELMLGALLHVGVDRWRQRHH